MFHPPFHLFCQFFVCVCREESDDEFSFFLHFVVQHFSPCEFYVITYGMTTESLVVVGSLASKRFSSHYSLCRFDALNKIFACLHQSYEHSLAFRKSKIYDPSHNCSVARCSFIATPCFVI